MKTILATLSLLALAAAAPGTASATPCDNEPGNDINLGFVGADGPLLTDGNGEQVCVGAGHYDINYGGAPLGIGYAVDVCYTPGSTTPCGVILGTTGASVACGPLVSLCVWFDGGRLV